MCAEPATLLLFGSTALKAAGSLQQGAATQSAENYNKKIARMQAGQERERGAFDEQRIRANGDFSLQDMAADWAKSGLRLDSGTPLERMAYAAGQLETDALLVRREADGRAIYRDNEANQANMRGRQAMRAGLFGVATSVLDGASKWKGMQ